MVEDLRKAKEEAEAKAEQAEATLQQQREEVEDAEAIEKARAWSHLNLDAEVVGKAIRRLNSVDAELAKSIEDVLSSVNAQAESSDIFAEIGKSVNLTNEDAYGRMTIMAKSLVDAGKVTSIEAGIASVAGSNPELYSQYLAEKGA
jgi:vesicle coat complex subunit